MNETSYAVSDSYLTGHSAIIFELDQRWPLVSAEVAGSMWGINKEKTALLCSVIIVLLSAT